MCVSGCLRVAEGRVASNLGAQRDKKVAFVWDQSLGVSGDDVPLERRQGTITSNKHTNTQGNNI